MSHCHHEHCDHDHDDLPESGEQFLLYSKIDIDNVRCLNEAEANSGKQVIRPWNERMDDTKLLESDADEQLIVFVPFTGSVKLRSICLRTDRTESAPSKMKVFTNREDVDFDAAESYNAVQEFDLVQSSNEVVEYDNFGGDTSVVRFIGFKGEWTEVKQDPIITVYEANANPADHKVSGMSDKMDYSIQ